MAKDGQRAVWAWVPLRGILIPNGIPPFRKNREKSGATPNWEFNLKGWASPRKSSSVLQSVIMATVSPTPAPTNPMADVRWTTLAQFFGLAAAGFYLLGFVIVTAHLGRFAAANRRLFDAQYVPAGVLFAVLVGVYFSFMKLFLFEAESVIRNVQKVGEPTGSPIFWGVTALLFQFLGTLFWLIFLTLLISSVFMEQRLGQILGQVSVPMILSTTLFLQGTFDRHPRLRVFAFLAVDVIGIAIVAAQRKHLSQPTISLFWVLLTVTLVLTMTMGVEQKIKSKFGVLQLAMPVVLLAGLAMYFGLQMYDKVPVALGGGKPVPVRLLVAPDSVPTVQQVLKLNSQLSDEVQLVMENQDEILLLTKRPDGSQQPLRLSRRLFSGVIPQN